MKKYLLLPLASITAFLFSCSKSIEDRLIGSWRLEESYRKVFLGRDHFQTGYESGIFTFYENGDAAYISSTDTLNGSWRAGNHNRSYYNSSSGQWDTEGMRYLKLNLYNFPRNKILNWEFDDFGFRNSWQRIKAEQYSLSNDRVYEFVHQ